MINKITKSQIQISNQSSKSQSLNYLIFKYSFVIWILSFVILVFTQPLFASIEIDPMRLELEADSGNTTTGYITITNRANETIDVSVSPGDYRYMFSSSTIYPGPGKPQSVPSCKSWISLKPDKLTLEKGKTASLEYSIKVPAASKGEYVGAILIDKEQPAGELKAAKTGQVRVKITPRINIPVYVAIKNSLSRSCEIQKLEAVSSTNKKFVWFSVTLKNNGTVHIRPAITLTMFDENKTVANKISMGKSLPIFADFADSFTANWTPRFAGKYTAVATVDIGAKDFIQKSVLFDVNEPK